MKGLAPILLALGLIHVAPAAADDKKQNGRLQNAAKVMTEIQNMPENILQGLLDKADCVIVLPSFVKSAFMVGPIAAAARNLTGPGVHLR